MHMTPSMGSFQQYRVFGLAVLGLSLSACAGAYPVPTQAMAKAAVELHLAEQEGARHTPDGARLCEESEKALKDSRKLVARGNNRESGVLAERGYEYAHQARNRAPTTTLAANTR